MFVILLKTIAIIHCLPVNIMRYMSIVFDIHILCHTFGFTFITVSETHVCSLQVKIESMCYFSTSRSVNFPTSAFESTMKNNLKINPGMKWQYFGSELGAMTLFPSTKQCSTTYDPRFRYLMENNTHFSHIIPLKGTYSDN